MKRLLKDQKGTVMVELALVLALLVVPVAIGVAKFQKPVIEWVTKTAGNLETNSKLQEENNALLKALLAKEGGTAPSPSPSPTSPTPTDPSGTEPRPRYVPDNEDGSCPSGYLRNNGVCTLQ